MGTMRTMRMAQAGKRRGEPRPESMAGPEFPSPRLTRTGKRLGEICFDCECRLLEIGGPDGMLLAWCECAFPDEHGEMEVG